MFFSKYWSFKQYFISFLSTLCLLFDNKDTFPSTVWVPYGLLLKVIRLQVTKMECRIYLHIFEVFLKLATYLLHISWNSATCLQHICCSKFHVVVLHSLVFRYFCSNLPKFDNGGFLSVGLAIFWYNFSENVIRVQKYQNKNYFFSLTFLKYHTFFGLKSLC